MQVETDRVWRVGGRHQISAELSVRIPHELEEITTQGRRRPASLFAWFDVSAKAGLGFGSPVALIREIEAPRTHRSATVRLDFRVALTTEVVEALLGDPAPDESSVSLRFQFRGVFRSRHREEMGLAGADVWGPMGVFWLEPEDPKWAMKVPSDSRHVDIVDGLTFEAGSPQLTPQLALLLESAPQRPGDVLGLRWSMEHVDIVARVSLQRQRGRSWITIGTLDATGTFDPEPAQPYAVTGDSGSIRADLGALADAGGRFRVRLATTGVPELAEHTEPFAVQVAAVELGSEPRTPDEKFAIHWIVQPHPDSGATVELERLEGETWTAIGVLGASKRFEAAPAEGREFRTPSPMGALPGVRLGEPGRAGGQLRLTLRVESLGLRRSTASFSVDPT